MCSEVAAGAVITQRRGSLHRLLIYHKHVIFHFKIHMNSDRRSALQSTVRCRTPVIHCLFICVRRYSQYSSSVPCDTSSSLVTHHTVDRVDMLTGTRWPDKLAAAMCCVVCLCAAALRDHSNVDCQVPRQPWPLLCRELLCWAWRRVHVYSSTLGTPAPTSLISITLFLSTRHPPTILREHHECALK